MSQLNFKGKQFVQNYHFSVPFRTLEIAAKKSVVPKGKKPDLEGNLIIHGDNLHALKALLPKYGGRVKCIYIDPPYNTGNEQWKYNDKVNSPMMQEWLGREVGRDDLTRHDKWLCMMMPRLKLLRELLREDGVIFISIDDNEVHYLRMLMDEIFGEENFLAVISWQGMDTIKNDARYFSTNTEYVVCYARDIERVNVHGIRKSEKQRSVYKNHDNDPRGPYLLTPLHAKSGSEEGVYNFTFPSGQIWRAPKGTYPRFSKETLTRLVREKRMYLDQEGKKTPQKKTYLSEVSERMRPWTFWKYEDFGSTRQANAELREILGRGEFQNPKPSTLIKRLIDLVADNDSIILDSFAGSGTMAHAVLALNKEDGGNRKFILVEMEDYADTITAERVRRVIRGVKNARNEDLKKGLGGAFSFVELGSAIDADGILSGKRLPSFLDMARYVFYIATGKNIDEKKVKESSGFIGETDEYWAYLVYKPDVAYLKTTALDLGRAKAIAKGKGGKRRLVFAPAKYLDQEALDEFRIDFVQLPFGVYRI